MQWYGIVKAGVARNMFCEVVESEIFRNQFGNLILSGAVGVDKWKEVGGVLEHHLRLISILTPLNTYMRKVSGDSWLLPQASLLSMDRTCRAALISSFCHLAGLLLLLEKGVKSHIRVRAGSRVPP